MNRRDFNMCASAVALSAPLASWTPYEGDGSGDKTVVDTQIGRVPATVDAETVRVLLVMEIPDGKGGRCMTALRYDTANMKLAVDRDLQREHHADGTDTFIPGDTSVTLRLDKVRSAVVPPAIMKYMPIGDALQLTTA